MTVTDDFTGISVTTESRDTTKAVTPADQIPESVKNVVVQANADRAKRVVVGPLADKVMATRFAGLAQAFGVNFPGGRVTVRATVRDDHSVALTVSDYEKRELTQDTKDKMRIAKLEAAVTKAGTDKAAKAKATQALSKARAEIAARSAA